MKTIQTLGVQMGYCSIKQKGQKNDHRDRKAYSNHCIAIPNLNLFLTFLQLNLAIS